FGPGGRAALGCSDGSVRVLDVASGEVRHVLRAAGRRGGGYPLVAFAADGRTVAGLHRADDASAAVVLWDAGGGQELRALTTDEYVGGDLRRLSFSPDGALVALGHTDRDWIGGWTV